MEKLLSIFISEKNFSQISLNSPFFSLIPLISQILYSPRCEQKINLRDQRDQREISHQISEINACGFAGKKTNFTKRGYDNVPVRN